MLLVWGCQGEPPATPPKPAAPPAQVDAESEREASEEEAMLRRFIAEVREGDEVAYRSMWHPDVRHRADVELLYRRYPRHLKQMVSRIEAALDRGVALEPEPLEPTDRGRERRVLEYRCEDRAGREHGCRLRLLSDFDGQWFVHDID